jgi:hypothetical protein
LNVADSDVVVPEPSVMVTPVPLMETVVEPGTKSVPVNVTGTDVPATPAFGDIVAVGAGGCTVNVCALLIPPAVVTVTLRAPAVATSFTVKVAVNVVGSETLIDVALTPLPLITTLVALLMKFVPVSVAVNEVPGTPVFGCTFVNVGC